MSADAYRRLPCDRASSTGSTSPVAPMNARSRFSRRRFSRLLGGCSAALLCSARFGAPWAAPARRALATALAPESLKMRAGRVIEILTRHIDTGYLSGAVALIGHGSNAEVVAVGDQSREIRALMRRDSLFRIT